MNTTPVEDSLLAGATGEVFDGMSTFMRYIPVAIFILVVAIVGVAKWRYKETVTGGHGEAV